MTVTTRHDAPRAEGDIVEGVQVEGLRKTYPGGVEALRGLSFSMPKGRIFGVLGPNGAGKTTMIRILATLSNPTAGTARVAGFDVERSPFEVRKRIGYVCQTSSVDSLSSGRENLVLQGHLYGLGGSDLRRRVDSLLERFGLTEASDRVVKTYSGGMRRRLDLAMGIIHEPSVLLLDEPTAGLDPESRTVMWETVRRLSGSRGIGILLTTHYMLEADRLSDRVAILDEGEIVARGAPGDLKTELRGDRVTVELSDPADGDRACEALRRIDGAASPLAGEDGRVHVQVERGARLIPTVVRTLEDAGIGLVEVLLSRPSLEDVFLNATGRSFAASDAEGDGERHGRRDGDTP